MQRLLGSAGVRRLYSALQCFIKSCAPLDMCGHWWGNVTNGDHAGRFESFEKRTGDFLFPQRNLIDSRSKYWCWLMPIVIRVCRRAPVTGLISPLIGAAKDPACLKPHVFSSNVCLGLGTQVNSGWAHHATDGQNSWFLEKQEFWGSTGSSAEEQPGTRYGCNERLCPTFRGALVGLCLEQDLSLWAL